MKTSTLAFYLSILAPLASAAALPAYPEGVAAVTVTDNIDYPGNSAVIERDLDAIQKRADHAVYFCIPSITAYKAYNAGGITNP